MDTKKWSVIAIVVLLVSCSFIFRSLLQSQLFSSDDYEHHAARTANYYLALKQGQFPPKWAPNLNNSLGYPAFLYTYHLPYAVATSFHVLHFSIQQSVNLSVFFFVILAVVSAYWYARSRKVSQSASIVLGLTYLLNPYLLLNIFWRGALGEIAFYSLLPLFFYALEQTIKKRSRRSSVLLISTTACLILSHFISVVVLVPVVLAYILVHFKTRKLHFKQTIWLAYLGFSGAMITAWYWVPALFERSFINYDSSKISSLYTDHFISLLSLIDITKTIFSSQYFLDVVQVGGVVLLAIALAVWSLWKNKKQLPMLFWLSVAILSLILVIPKALLIWQWIPQLTVMQFPWRFLWLTNLSVFFLLVLFFQNATKKTVILVCIVVATLWSTYGYAQPKGYFSRSDFDWYEAVTTASSFDEFRPKWSNGVYDLPDKVIVPDASSSAETIITNWNGSHMRYQIKTDTQELVVQKTLYFPGWQATIDGEPVAILFENNYYPGLIALKVPAGQHAVAVDFTGITPIRTASTLITIIGLIGVAVLLFFSKE